MKITTRLFTYNMKSISLLWVTFNWQHYCKYGAKDSCMLHMHPLLTDDEYIKEYMRELCDYIREHYDMGEII